MSQAGMAIRMRKRKHYSMRLGKGKNRGMGMRMRMRMKMGMMSLSENNKSTSKWPATVSPKGALLVPLAPSKAVKGLMKVKNIFSKAKGMETRRSMRSSIMLWKQLAEKEITIHHEDGADLIFIKPIVEASADDELFIEPLS